MPNKTIIVAGRIRNIGVKIINALLKKAVEVRFDFHIYVYNSTKYEYSFFFN